MICLTTDQTAYANDLCDVIRLFYPDRGFTEDCVEADMHIAHTHEIRAGLLYERCRIGTLSREDIYDMPQTAEELERVRLEKRYAKRTLYALLSEHSGRTFPWGSLTGIRPTALCRTLMREGRSRGEALSYMGDFFGVSAGKLALVEDVLSTQEGIYAYGDDKSFDVYVGIPFCKSRCVYCSFYTSAMDEALSDAYVEGLEREALLMGEGMHRLGMKVRTVYFGGGTPTAIGNRRLERVLRTVNSVFPGAQELTVEAGRPDTVDEETFPMLRENGVGRVSINPQSMNAATLEVIGRSHTPQEIERAFALAKDAGMPSINMDIIAGLPGEDVSMFRATLDALGTYDMENFTVHTLAVKRSSRLHERLKEYSLPDSSAVESMLGEADAFTRARGMRAYYMYRQKYMSGNLENVGYAKAGTECIYNVDMMEETHNVLALGSGALSRHMLFAQSKHARFANPSEVRVYLSDLDERVDRKLRFFAGEQ